MKLSVVTTIYKSEKFIEIFYKRIVTEIELLKIKDYEIIFVNDGSPDNSDIVIKRLSEKDSNIKSIELSRNFGHHAAMMAGLENSIGDLVFLIDVDLEDKPEWLSLFYKKIIKSDIDVVYGIQKKRGGNYFRKLSGKIWYYILNNIVNFKHPYNITTARLMNKKFVNDLKNFKEKSFVISAIWELAGYKQTPIEVEKTYNEFSTYKFSKRLDIVIKFLTGYSNKTLKFILSINFCFSIIALIYSFFLLLQKLFINEDILSGWTSLMIFISLSYFFISLCLLFIGLYIAQISEEVKNRPRYLIKKIT